MFDRRSAARALGPLLLMLLAAFPALAENSGGSYGQRLYVPVYSEIPYGTGRNTIRLTATLSIRNTDPERSIVILRAGYYDSSGKLLREFIDEPTSIGPLASHYEVVRESERKGGVGANFIVEWSSRKPAVRPLVQTLMLRTASQQGVAFVGESVLIEEFAPPGP